ncbi:MAG: hypothetical protein AB2535_20970, partial [Candidatus Thiodiazotropha endolucinida]
RSRLRRPEIRPPQARAEMAQGRHRAFMRHANGVVRSITNQGSVPAAPDTPMAIPWRPTLRGLDARQGSLQRSLWIPIDQTLEDVPLHLD